MMLIFDAWRIAINIAKLPELLGVLRKAILALYAAWP
jgi:hypothetical protein